MGPRSKERGLRMLSLAPAGTRPTMVETSEASGKLPSFMGLERMHGREDESMRATTIQIRSMVSEFSHGQTVESMRASGKMASRMDRARLQNQMEFPRLPSGKMG